jgi:hypothetical protein
MDDESAVGIYQQVVLHARQGKVALQLCAYVHRAGAGRQHPDNNEGVRHLERAARHPLAAIDQNVGLDQLVIGKADAGAIDRRKAG